MLLWSKIILSDRKELYPIWICLWHCDTFYDTQLNILQYMWLHKIFQNIWRKFWASHQITLRKTYQLQFCSPDLQYISKDWFALDYNKTMLCFHPPKQYVLLLKPSKTLLRSYLIHQNIIKKLSHSLSVWKRCWHPINKLVQKSEKCMNSPDGWDSTLYGYCKGCNNSDHFTKLSFKFPLQIAPTALLSVV